MRVATKPMAAGAANSLSRDFLSIAIEAVAAHLHDDDHMQEISTPNRRHEILEKYQVLLAAMVQAQAAERLAGCLEHGLGDLAGRFSGLGSIGTSVAALADNLDKVAAEMYAANLGRRG